MIIKKIFRILFFVALVLCGCVREETGSSYVKTITANFENCDATRARLSQDGEARRMFWEAADSISVLSGNANLAFELIGGAGSPNGVFHNSEGVPAGECYAVYPFSQNVSLSGTSVNLQYPSELQYDADGRVTGGDFMVARSSDANFKFKNVHSYLSLSFTAAGNDEVATIVVEERNGATIAGAATVTFSEGIPLVTMTGSGKSVTVLMNNASIGPDAPLKVLIPLAPVFADGIKVTVTTASGLTRVFTSSAAIGRNEVVEMNETALIKPAEASINSYDYQTLKEALADLPKYSNAVVTLLRDVKYDEVLTISGSNPVTLDLAGHSLQLKSLISIADKAVLTDSSPKITGILSSPNNRALQVNAGNFTIEGGTIKSIDSSAVHIMGSATDTARVIFNGGIISSENAQTMVYVRENGFFDMHGGNIIAKMGYVLHARSLTEEQFATINVDGGKVSGSASHILYAYTGARFNISGGFFQTTSGRVVHNGTSQTGVKVKITGGYFHVTGYPEKRYFSGFNSTSVRNIFVTGGYYNVDPLAESTKASKDQALTISAPYAVKQLDTPAVIEGYSFPYEVARDYDGIIVGYSQNGTSTSTRNAFKKCFEDAGARLCFFEDYVTTDDAAEEYMSLVDALVIPGSASSDASNRSSSDCALIRAAISQGKPVLGVCYGQQRICLVKGGSVPSIAKTYPTTKIVHKEVIDGVNYVRTKVQHSITIDKSSILYNLLGTETIMVNSSHNYCCLISNGAMKIVATAPDGCCEALESTTPGECVIGVQFHPEYLYSVMEYTKFLNIFKYIVDQAQIIKEKMQ